MLALKPTSAPGPAAPDGATEFSAKFRAGEGLKEFYWEILEGGNAEATLLREADDFFAEAFEFHQLPAPPAVTEARYIEATLDIGIRAFGVGYLRMKSGAKLRPVRALALTDLTSGLRILQAMAKKGALTDAQAQQKAAEIHRLRLLWTIRDLEYWIERAREDRDSRDLAERITYMDTLHRARARPTNITIIVAVVAR